MGLFNNKTQQITQRQKLEYRYNSARNNILWVLIFTVVNIGLLLAGRFSYFLFSAYVPYAIVDSGMYFCGRYPEWFYMGEYYLESYYASSVLIVMVAIAAVICIVYLLCWLFSKKGRVGWMIAGLVLFTVDTVLLLLNGINFDFILDYLFHAWVVVSFITGVSAHYKLKKLPPEEPVGPEIVE